MFDNSRSSHELQYLHHVVRRMRRHVAMFLNSNDAMGIRLSPVVLYCVLTLFALSGCNQSTNQLNVESDFGHQSKSDGPTQNSNSMANAGLEGSDQAPKQSRFDPNAEVTSEQIASADVSALFIGNSHSYPIPQLLTEIFERQKPDLTVLIRRAPLSGFLVNHLEGKTTAKWIEKGPWGHVILQAQKYSTSGKYEYPTDAAKTLSKLAKKMNARVIMYPEWSQRDYPDEFKRIRLIHDSIASETGAKVAPIGESWQSIAEISDNDDLFAADGNHASKLGSYLNACVFYSLITGESAERPVDQNESRIDFRYRQMEQAAWEQVKNSIR